MKWPKVSVIIPFYKGTDWLIEALDSVFLQNYPNIEILVINDGSPEELHAVEEKYLNRVIWINQQNSGPAAARNAGIDAATGKYVALLDADDIWFENKLFHQIAEMEKTGAIWSHHSFEMFWENSTQRKKVSTASYQGDVLAHCYISFKAATDCFIVRRDALNAHHIRYPAEKRYGEDVVFYKALASRFPLQYVDGVYAGVRVRGSNAGMSARIQLLDRADAWKELKQNRNRRALLPGIVVLGYRLAHILKKPVQYTKGGKGSELAARFLYGVPYVCFKIGKILNGRRKRELN